jgi:hypothetical protein
MTASTGLSIREQVLSFIYIRLLLALLMLKSGARLLGLRRRSALTSTSVCLFTGDDLPHRIQISVGEETLADKVVIDRLAGSDELLTLRRRRLVDRHSIIL